MKWVLLFLFGLTGQAHAQAPTKMPVCEAAYRELYSKGKVDIRVVFGYKDARPARFVGDRHERAAFVQRILEPCVNAKPSAAAACGFERSEENSDIFLKTIPGVGRSLVHIKLVIVNSSTGSDDETNRTNPHQVWQSAYSKSAFTNGLDKADVVLYNGHSRFGGGPDFEPPRLNAKGEVDPSAYVGKQEGFQTVREKLRARARNSATKSDLKLLGLFSCASLDHFSQGLKHDTSAGLISSRALIYHSDALESSLGALSALLQRSCATDFQNALRPRGTKSGARLDGFF